MSLRLVKLVFLFFVIFASFYSSFADVPKNSSQILRDHLDRLRSPDSTDIDQIHIFLTTGEFLKSLTNTLKTEFVLCEDEIPDEQYESRVTSCLRHELKKIIKKARRERVIDEVEVVSLMGMKDEILWKNDEITFNSKAQIEKKAEAKVEAKQAEQYFHDKDKKESPEEKFSFSAAGVSKMFAPPAPPKLILPPLAEYEYAKNFFRFQRIENHVSAELDVKTLDLLEKMYHRKIKKVGRVGTLEYILSKYNRFQINILGDMFNKLNEMKLAKKATIVTEDAQGNAVDEFELSPTDKTRYTIKRLDLAINLCKYNPLMKGITPSYGDIITAAYIRGDIDTNILKAVLQAKELDEYFESTALQVAKLVWSSSKVLLLINPYTSTFYIVGTIVVESIHRKKEYEDAQARKSHIF